MGRPNSKIILLALFFVPNNLYAKSNEKLPPSWNAGGRAREEYLYERKRKTNQEDEPEFLPSASVAKRHSLGILGALPDFSHLEYRYSATSKIAIILGTSAPIPIKVKVEMPSDVIKADPAKGIAVAYPAFDIDFEVTWGPHIYTGFAWHPFGGIWFTSFAGAFRLIEIRGKASTPLRICSITEAAKEPPCGNDLSAIQTRNSISLKTESKMYSYATRTTTGWILGFSPDWAGIFELGVFAPFSSKKTTNAEANLVSPDGTAEELKGALDELRTKSETDVSQKANIELEKYIQRPLPVISIGIYYRF